MTQLSPAAQAVMDAWVENTLYAPIDNEPLALAAALRAAANQVVPEQLAEPRGTGFRWGGWAAKQWVRNRLLAIADELESQ
jgi:hypothetical protein